MHNGVNVSAASKDLAVVEFSRAEVLALRNLLEYAPHVAMEARGPLGIFQRLLAELEPIAASWAASDPSVTQPTTHGSAADGKARSCR